MKKLSIIWATLSITKNPLAGLTLKLRNKRRDITFKNRCTYFLTWTQFRYLRDSYHVFSKYRLTQLEQDFFRFESPDGIINCSSALLFLICKLMLNYTIRQEKLNLFHLKNAKVELLGSNDMLVCVEEQISGEYQCDCKGKIVLDVGGFEGETAVYFWENGAKKIIIYEPIAEHIEFIKRNTSLNNINAEIHETGIGKKDEKLTIHYEKIDPGFGINSKGSNSIEIQLSDVSKVINESNADIAKFDCEGAEFFLIDVPAKVLQKIPFYIIEVHSIDIRKAIMNKFESIGYALNKEIPKHSSFSVLFFQKRN